ncbi:MAG: hypothetical protein AB4206_01210 [Xenococcaceae cyanobacterium]
MLRRIISLWWFTVKHGNRRTGTLLAAYLVAQGELPEQAISIIQFVRPTAELRDAQKQFLLQLPQLLR